MTAMDRSVKRQVSLRSIKTGAIAGLVGGALIGFMESVCVLIATLGPPASPEPVEAATLMAGLAFLCALTALGASLGLAALGTLLVLWQTVRRMVIAPAPLIALFGTVFAAVYTLLRGVDSLGISELSESGIGAAVWGMLLLCLAAGVGYATWLILNALANGWQQGRERRLRFLRLSTIHNLVIGLLIVLGIVPPALAGARWLIQRATKPGAVVHAKTTATSAGRINIILVTIDALRADHIGTYGYEKARTPNIDAFAAQGVLFEQATSQAPWTFPSFAAMFTSMYPTELNLGVGNKHIGEMYNQRVDDARVTLAEALQASGYHTQAIVTNPWLKPEFGFAQGFDGFVSVDEPRLYHLENLDGLTLVKIARQSSLAYRALETVYTWITGNPGQPLVWDVRADRVTEEAIAWLRSNQHQPFFLWVHYIDPHYPFDPPEGYRPIVDGVTTERMGFLSSYNEEEVYTGRARLRPQDKAALAALYDGEIAYNDFFVGQLFAEIDALGLRDNSVVILSSDHGDEFWEHGGYQHGQSLYDELIHVPLIIRGPGVFAEPRRITADVQHLDLMPTLLDLIGRDAPAEAQGRSLLPLLRGDAQAPPATTFTFAEALFLGEERKAIRGNGFKLIYLPFSNEFELYDLIRDPAEKNNLAQSDASTVENLSDMLKEWLLAARERGAALPRSHNQDEVDPGAVERLRSGGY